MSSSPFGFATTLSLSLPFSPPRAFLFRHRGRFRLSLPLTCLLSLPSPPSCRYLPPNIFSISSISSLPPKSSPPPPLQYTLTFYFPLVVKSNQPSNRSFFFLRSCFSFPFILLHLRSSPFSFSSSRGVHVGETTNRARKRGREGGGGLRSNRSDLRPASEKGNLGEPHTTTTTGEREKVRWITNGPLGGN